VEKAKEKCCQTSNASSFNNNNNTDELRQLILSEVQCEDGDFVIRFHQPQLEST
jgi:hypothetical protein